jgi:hypothetical protein
MYLYIVARTLRWQPRFGDRINAYSILVEILVDGFKLKIETSEVLHLEHSFIWYWNLDTSGIDHSYLKSFELWCWRRTEKISCTDRVRNEVSRKREISYMQ